MLFNRRLQLSVVKNDDTAEPKKTNVKTSDVDIAQIVRDTTKQIATYVAIGIGGYIVLDTARQCAVKATPEH